MERPFRRRKTLGLLIASTHQLAGGPGEFASFPRRSPAIMRPNEPTAPLRWEAANGSVMAEAYSCRTSCCARCHPLAPAPDEGLSHIGSMEGCVDRECDIPDVYWIGIERGVGCDLPEDRDVR